MHRLDRISAKKPAKLLDSKSLTLGFSREQIWPVFYPNRGCAWAGTETIRGATDIAGYRSGRALLYYRLIRVIRWFGDKSAKWFTSEWPIS